MVDAMTTAGADAITINQRRVTPETVIDCVGDTVVLDGVPYPQPFVIEAVGDHDTLVRTINRSDYLAEYRAQASNPLIGVWWVLEVETRVEAPASRPAESR